MKPPIHPEGDIPQSAAAVKEGARRHVVVCINGILTLPGASDAWTDRAVTWLHLHTDFRAEKFEYSSGALTRRVKQQARAEKIARMIEHYQRAGWTVSLIGHSNGCDLILRVLPLLSGPVHAVHLVAAACAADFEANGLNDAIESGTLSACTIFASRADKALLFARITARPLSIAGLGYGSLGRSGPLNVTKNASERVTLTDRPGYGHSTWFADELGAGPAIAPRHTPFEETMRAIHSAEILSR